MALTRAEWPRHLIYNPFIGCKRGGTSTGCRNCTARHTAVRNAYAYKNGSAHNFGFGHEACVHVLENLGNGKPVAWNGEVIYNPYATDRLEKLVSPREILVNMSGDIGCADREQLERIMKKLTSKKLSHHFFTLVTKYPEKVEETLCSAGTPRNIGVYVSVESEKHMDRVETLRAMPDTLLKGVWLKPFLGPFGPKTDFSGMLDISIAGEVANNFRPFPLKAAVNCAAAADRANARLTVEALSAKDWLSAQQKSELKKALRYLKQQLKKRK